jgi:type I restriction enzyme S subunit
MTLPFPKPARKDYRIDLVREYRTRLITDIVTDQLDVRGVAPPAESDVAGLTDWIETEELEDDISDAQDTQEDLE